MRSPDYLVATQGGPASNSDIAVNSFFSAEATRLDCPDIPTALAAVEAGQAMYGVVPLENSSTGTPYQDTYGELARRQLMIFGQRYWHIEHQFIGTSPQRLEAIQARIQAAQSAGEEVPVRIFSHPYGLDACRNWLKDNLPGAHIESTNDTANSVRDIVAQDNPNYFAIANRSAAALYGASIIVPRINDIEGNFTTFPALCRAADFSVNPHADTTAMVVKPSGPDHPRALLQVIKGFGSYRTTRGQPINLSYIKSHPVKGTKGQYDFYLDAEVGMRDDRLLRVVKRLTKRGFTITVVGSFVAAKEPEPTT